MSDQLRFELQEQHVLSGHYSEFSRRSLLGQAVLASACGIVGLSSQSRLSLIRDSVTCL